MIRARVAQIVAVLAALWAVAANGDLVWPH
jgi:hypothetical protein